MLSYFGRRLHLRRGLGVGILARQSDFRARTKFLLGSNDLKENRMMVMNNRRKQDFVSYNQASHDSPFPPASRSKRITAEHSIYIPRARNILISSFKHLRDNASIANVEVAADMV